MRLLSAQDILRVWELGQRQPGWYQALLVLSAAFPQVPQRELAALSIGQRNTYLFALRDRQLGSDLNAFALCPQCSESLEFQAKVGQLCPVHAVPAIAPELSLSVEDIRLRFRLLNSADLAAAAHCMEIPLARQQLIHQCVIEASRNGQAIAVDELPEVAIAALEEAMIEHDPQSTIRLNLSCPACHHEWMDEFDIGSFFWMELNVQARRLLSEVHVLAKAYGWHESEILAMSAFRRQAYLEGVL